MLEESTQTKEMQTDEAEMQRSFNRIAQLMAEEAGIAFNQVVLDSDEERILYAAAYHAYENGKYNDAIHFFRYLTGCKPANTDYWMGLGAAQQMNKQFQDAIYAYGAAALLKSEYPQVHLHAADCFFALKQRTEGLQALTSAELVIGQKEEPMIRKHIKLMRQLWDKPLSNEG